MKEHPILFSGPMVRALLEGRKTQTRRIINPQPEQCGFGRNAEVSPYCTGTRWPLAYYERRGACWNSSPALKCPCGEPGNLLWVRETFAMESSTCPVFAADQDDLATVEKWTPAIFMPRSISRVRLEITDVRVQRLQEITEDESNAEGFPSHYDVMTFTPARSDFAVFWDSINAKRGYGWHKNPWVWAISFRRI